MRPDGEEAKGAVTLYRVSATPVGEVSDVAEERRAVRICLELASADSAVVLDETSGLAGFRIVLPARR